jgi:hypothetical protein
MRGSGRHGGSPVAARLAHRSNVGGFTVIGVGIIGTLLPINPGIPMVIAGVALVSPGHPVLSPVMTRIERRRGRKQGS